jgi:cytochrome c5
MSENSPAPAHPAAHDEAHTGPIKTPKQLLQAVFLSFVVPIFIIIGLVYFVVSGFKPAGTADPASMTLGGVSEQSRAVAKANRLQKVGAVEIRDANREMKSGEQVFKAQCASCHATGAAGSPKLGDAGVWAPRLKTGFDSLLTSALKGKNGMPAQSGGEFEEFEISRAVVYMSNAGGGKFPEPVQPAAAK